MRCVALTSFAKNLNKSMRRRPRVRTKVWNSSTASGFLVLIPAFPTCPPFMLTSQEQLKLGRSSKRASNSFSHSLNIKRQDDKDSKLYRNLCYTVNYRFYIFLKGFLRVYRGKGLYQRGLKNRNRKSTSKSVPRS